MQGIFQSSTQYVQVLTEQNVLIKKPDLYPSLPDRVDWQVLYNGGVIKVSILDPYFIDKINSGTKFGQGDGLIVDLGIKNKLDMRTRGYIKMEYEIIKVRGICTFTIPVDLNEIDFLRAQIANAEKMVELTKDSPIMVIGFKNKLEELIGKLEYLLSLK